MCKIHLAKIHYLVIILELNETIYVVCIFSIRFSIYTETELIVTNFLQFLRLNKINKERTAPIKQALIEPLRPDK